MEASKGVRPSILLYIHPTAAINHLPVKYGWTLMKDICYSNLQRTMHQRVPAHDWSVEGRGAYDVFRMYRTGFWLDMRRLAAWKSILQSWHRSVQTVNRPSLVTPTMRVIYKLLYICAWHRLCAKLLPVEVSGRDIISNMWHLMCQIQTLHQSAGKWENLRATVLS